MNRREIYPGFPGAGEYISTDTATELAQTKFLVALNRLYPDYPRELESVALPLFADAIASGRVSRGQGLFLLHIEAVAPELYRTIADWCGRHNLVGIAECEPEFHGDQWQIFAFLKQHWPERRVIEALFRHSRVPSNPGPLRFPTFSYHVGQARGRDIEIRTIMRPWNPLAEKRTRAYERMKFVAEADIRKYLEDVEHSVKSSSDLRRISKTVTDEHFDWAVMYQVGGVSPGRIGLKVHKSKDAVQEAIVNVLKASALKKRPGKRGPRVIPLSS